MKNNGFFRIFLVVFVIIATNFQSQAQIEPKPIINASLTGKVVDAYSKRALQGVTVQLEAVTHSVRTDANGDFQFVTGQKLPFTLIVSYVGYQKKRIVVETSPATIELTPLVESISEVTVTSRRRSEQLQDIPIPVSIVRGAAIEDAGAFNVNRLKELIPTVQLYASNPRNTTLNIRGLGSTYGLTNDGIDPGVGFYLDGVYLARPAATALDFIDIEQVEVLRGPQGTLFGKNTTAGAFNITSRLPSFNPEATFEASYGNYGHIQARTSISGGLIKDLLAARISFSGTQRDGTLYNVATDRQINDINNLGLRGQLLFTPAEDLKISLSGDVTKQRPDGYGWAVAGVTANERSAHRQFNKIIEDLGYKIPYSSAFERKIDLDTRSRADNELGGAALNVDYKIGNGTLTSTTAWRYWDWVPLNDRDYLGIPVYTISAGNSKHNQYSQEFRYAGEINDKLSGVVGLFGLWQNLRTDPVHTEEVGDAYGRFAQNNAAATDYLTPGLFSGVGIRTNYGIKSTSLAAFGQLDWKVTEQLHVLPGIRYNYDKKIVDYDRKAYSEGDVSGFTADQLKLRNAVYVDQQFNVDDDETNFSGQLTVQYRFTPLYNAYATYSRSYKPIGVNVGGLLNKTDGSGQPDTDLAVVKPEAVNHFEIGVKTSPTRNTFFNITAYQTNIDDYQIQVQSPDPSVNRGYLANAEKVRVQGLEIDGSYRPWNFLRINAALAYTDGKYVTFKNAPLPLEETGKAVDGAQVYSKDVSGQRLPGISKWAGSFGTELTQAGNLIGLDGSYFLGADLFFRSEFSSSATPSTVLNIPAYSLLNARLGFNASNGVSVFVWSRNLTDTDYHEQLLAAPGNYGQYASVVGDPLTYGVTLRYNLR